MEKRRVIERFELPNREERPPRPKIRYSKGVAFLFLLLFCLLWISPFVIMFFGSLRGHYDTTYYPAELFPPHNGFTLENFELILFGIYPEGVVHNTTADIQMGYWFLNSCYSAIGGTLLYLLIASLTAYVFVFVDFRFRKVLFGILVATLVVPGVATQIGNQSTIFAWGLNTNILGLIIPSLCGVYGLYLIKTFFEGIPKDLVESAKMDGCSNLRIYARIVLPLGKSVLYVQGLFGFMAGWNDLVWPRMLYATQDSKLWTLQVGISYIINNSRTSDLIGSALAAGVICLLPVLIVFLIAQSKIIEGMASAGIKG